MDTIVNLVSRRAIILSSQSLRILMLRVKDARNPLQVLVTSSWVAWNDYWLCQRRSITLSTFAQIRGGLGYAIAISEYSL